jgi:hypothetical protein
MFCPVDRNGRPWSTVRCLRCGRVYSVHYTLPCPRLPQCIRCRGRRLSAAKKQVSLFPPTPEQILARHFEDE